MNTFTGIRWLAVSALVGAIGAVAGCGGSSVGNTNSSGERTMSFGSLTTRVAGTPQPPVTASGYSSVSTGIAGATFSGMGLSGANSIAGSKIVFVNTDKYGTGRLFVMNPDGSNAVPLTTVPANGIDSISTTTPAWSRDGRIAFTGDPGDGSQLSIFVINADGTGLKRLTNGLNPCHSPTWSPDSAKIAYVSNGFQTLFKDNIFVMNSDGTGSARLTQGDGEIQPSWAPDGKKIAYTGETFHPTYVDRKLFTMNADGSGVTLLHSSLPTISWPSWSADGAKIAFANNIIGHQQICTINADGTGLNYLTGFGPFDSHPTWSPDGKRIAFQRAIGDTDKFQLMSVDSSTGRNPAVLTGESSDDSSPAWSPAPSRTFIGPGGVLGTAAAGFVYNQSGDDFTGVLAFDTSSPNTRANARITAQNGQSFSPSNLIMSITLTDSFSSLNYINDLYASTAISVISGGNSAASGALVSIDQGTGKFASVLPYAANRSAGGGAPLPRRDAGVLIYDARFLGVWDENGKNLAPNGASEVRIEAATGKLLGFKWAD